MRSARTSRASSREFERRAFRRRAFPRRGVSRCADARRRARLAGFIGSARATTTVTTTASSSRWTVGIGTLDARPRRESTTDDRVAADATTTPSARPPTTTAFAVNGAPCSWIPSRANARVGRSRRRTNHRRRRRHRHILFERIETPSSRRRRTGTRRTKVDDSPNPKETRTRTPKATRARVIARRHARGRRRGGMILVVVAREFVRHEPRLCSTTPRRRRFSSHADGDGDHRSPSRTRVPHTRSRRRPDARSSQRRASRSSPRTRRR